MTPNSNSFTPDYAVHPGRTIEETMAATGISQSELALRTGLSRKTINGILHGREPLTPDTALQLEKVFRVPARFWNNLQLNHDEIQARLHAQDRLRQYADWPKQMGIPLKELVRRGHLPSIKDPIERLSALLTFFGVASPAEYEMVWVGIQKAYAFRKSNALRTEFGAISTWLRIGELDAQRIECAPFDRDRLRQTLPLLRRLATRPSAEFQPEVVRLCAERGVAVVYVPGIKGAPIHGATRWLTPQKAVLQLSGRGKDDGNFWFSFFHEIGHLLLHGKREVFLEMDRSRPTESEAEADCFARDLLIPRASYQAFIERQAGRISKTAIERFANELGITPGIVVGRLQHEKKVPFSHCNDLKSRVGFVGE